jgi:hypothetical protein
MEYMGIVKELEQKLVLNQDKHDCHADNGEVLPFKLCHIFGLVVSFYGYITKANS